MNIYLTEEIPEKWLGENYVYPKERVYDDCVTAYFAWLRVVLRRGLHVKMGSGLPSYGVPGPQFDRVHELVVDDSVLEASYPNVEKNINQTLAHLLARHRAPRHDLLARVIPDGVGPF